MSHYKIGRSVHDQRNIFLDTKTLGTHQHILGATGTGKSTLLVRVLTQLFVGIAAPSTVFVIDPLGGLAESLVNFIAHPVLCPDSVRQRFIYIQPSLTDYVMPINPLRSADESDLYFRTSRTSDVMLRSGQSHDMTIMLRLRRWLHNCFYSIGALGYPPSAAQFLVRPGTDQHNQLLNQIPPQLQIEWAEIMRAGLRERLTILDSTRNRLNPFFSCPTLNYMLSSTLSNFDVANFMRQKKIVIVNLAPHGKIDSHIASTIGGLMVNEIIQTARNLPRSVVAPTQLVLDEFQNFVGDDLYDALPETRQIGLQLWLSHQSFSQLENSAVDMRGIVWQARNRFMFANDAEDADMLAHELASLTFDPMELKDKIEVFRQKKIGQEIERLRNYSSTNTTSAALDQTSSVSTNHGKSYRGGLSSDGQTYNDAKTTVHGTSRKSAESAGTSEGWSETLVDQLEDFYEESSRTYFTFDEQMRRWAQKVRKLSTGEAIAKFKDDNEVYHIQCDRLVIPETESLADLKAELLEKNFSNRELFIPTVEVKADWNRFVAELGAGNSVPPNQPTSRPNKIERRQEDDDESFR